jgi:hypothetical protein
MDLHRTPGKRVSANLKDFVTAENTPAVIDQPWQPVAVVAFSLLMIVRYRRHGDRLNQRERLSLRCPINEVAPR